MWYSFNIQNLYICGSNRNWNAYANQAKNVNKDSPIKTPKKAQNNEVNFPL